MEDWLWEMEMCFSMQLNGLKKDLLERKGKPVTEVIKMHSGIYSAPRNESLFDGLHCWMELAPDGHIKVFGAVNYWHPDRGGWGKSAVIKTFDTFDDCLEWLDDRESTSSQECAITFWRLGR